MLAELHLDKAVGVASKAKPRGSSAVKAAAEDTATVRRHMQVSTLIHICEQVPQCLLTFLWR